VPVSDAPSSAAPFYIACNGEFRLLSLCKLMRAVRQFVRFLADLVDVVILIPALTHPTPSRAYGSWAGKLLHAAITNCLRSVVGLLGWCYRIIVPTFDSRGADVSRKPHKLPDQAHVLVDHAVSALGRVLV
jgi:hypothetical protein